MGICMALDRGKLAHRHHQTPSAYLGYIDTHPKQEAFRHSFHLSNEERDCRLKNQASLEQALELSTDQALTYVGQLKLAHDVAVAVLKFHSTPWLESYFTPKDLSYFRLQDDFSASLDALHFDCDFGAVDQPLLAGADDNDAEMQCA
ncbi:uncharacterized protein PG998_015046 [Apiospora kogelbergensis]|uniref:uncharacterized protein n=1 Tax=Apiospora kogelbergensis TaxID=1337665 RepID=UPI00313284C9